MANTLITTSYLANKSLDVLENELVFAKSVNKQYAKEFGDKDFQVGATINIRRPPRYIGTFGPNLNVEDTNQTYVPVSINYQFLADGRHEAQRHRTCTGRGGQSGGFGWLVFCLSEYRHLGRYSGHHPHRF